MIRSDTVITNKGLELLGLLPLTTLIEELLWEHEIPSEDFADELEHSGNLFLFLKKRTNSSDVAHSIESVWQDIRYNFKEKTGMGIAPGYIPAESYGDPEIEVGKLYWGVTGVKVYSQQFNDTVADYKGIGKCIVEATWTNCD